MINYACQHTSIITIYCEECLNQISIGESSIEATTDDRFSFTLIIVLFVLQEFVLIVFDLALALLFVLQLKQLFHPY